MANATMSKLRDHIDSVIKSDDRPNSLTRYIGGYKRENYPYINGYWQLIIQPPREIFGSDASLMQKWFLSTAEGYTPPTRNLNKVDIPGQGGMGSSFVAGQTLTRTFSTTHREYSKLVMSKLIGVWTNVIDSLVGVSELESKKWSPSSYKGLIYIILTKPVGAGKSKLDEKDLEEVYLYDGVWPDTQPTDALNQDINTNDSVVLNINWNFDGWPLSAVHEESIATKALDLLNSLGSYSNHYERMIKDLGIH